MIVRPGQGGIVANFTYTLGSILTVADTVAVTVLRNGVDTVVPVTISTSSAGRYQAEFDIPANWDEYDLVATRFEGASGGMFIECTKPLAVVGEMGLSVQQDADLTQILNLLEADEIISGGKAQKRLRGTSTVLLEKDISGSTCADDVSLTE